MFTSRQLGATAVGLAWPADGAAVEAAKARGLYVMTYSANDPAAVLAAAGAGVDAIVTDDPLAARLALDRDRDARRYAASPASASDWFA